MKISKLKLIVKYICGGLADVAEYLLDLFNEQLAKLPREDVAKYAQLAKDIANFIGNCCALIKSNERRFAAQATAGCFADLATALLDAKLTEDEIDAICETIKHAINAWKEAK